ncbi:glycerophosphodiester phosphodiesterase [Candidatus Poribacteria bacterium]|nr:glycerophosphodiester phosphodiesterase [Candidatus Poribacteria bacterium]
MSALGPGLSSQSRRKPLNMAHRGGVALAPENTMVAFENAVRIGVDVLELDVHLTRDRRVVVSHDATVDRATNGSGPIAGMSFDELSSLDAGYRFTPDGGKSYPYRGTGVVVPLFSDVLSAFPETRVNVDLKSQEPELAQLTLDAIDGQEARDRVCVASFYHGALERFREISSGRVATSASPFEARLFAYVLRWLPRLWSVPYDALQVPLRHRRCEIASHGFIWAAHRWGVEVHVYDADDEPSIRRSVALGVDGIISDRPDLVRQVLEDIHP